MKQITNQLTSAYCAVDCQVGVIMKALLNDQQEHQANPDCGHCHGRGAVVVANGDDDYDPELCECVLSTF